MQPLETGDALAMAGISRGTWNDVISRKYYTAAPETTQGKPRYFTRDDVVSLFVFDHYVRLGTGPSLASRVASAVAVELQKAGENVDFLWVVANQDGRPLRVISREPKESFRHEIPVRELREKIEKLAAKRLASR